MNQRKKSILKSLLLLSISLLVFSCTNTPVIYLVGDSTMSQKTNPESPERGWGMLLPDHFNESVKIENHAMNGRSSRSFTYEGRWDSVMGLVKKDDYVVIQFGHNDDVITKTGRYSTPEEYSYNMTRFILDTKAKSANPILCTPIQRRKLDTVGQLIDTHGVYPEIVRELGEEFDIPVIDMQRMSEELIEDYGIEKSKLIFLHFAPGEINFFPKGKEDNTHFSELGGELMAGLFVRGLKKINHPLVTYLKNDQNAE